MLNYLYPKLNNVSASAIIEAGLTSRYPRIKGEKKEGGDSELQNRAVAEPGFKTWVFPFPRKKNNASIGFKYNSK
jgi:hypothetical protein